MRKYRIVFINDLSDIKDILDFKSFDNEFAMQFAMRVFKETNYKAMHVFERLGNGTLWNQIAFFERG